MKRLIASLLAVGAAGLISAQGVHFGIGARGTFGFGLGSSTNVAENYAKSYYDALWDAWVDQARSYGLSVGRQDDFDPGWDDMKLKVKPFESIVAGGALIGRITFDAVPGLFLQPEIGFSHNIVKYKFDWEYETRPTTHSRVELECEGTGSMSYSSIDIPIIAGYDFEVGPGMVLSPYGGLNLSIPVGKVSWSDDAATTTTRAYYDGRLIDGYPDKSKSNSSSVDAKITNGVIPGLILGGSFGYKFDDHNMIMGDLRYLLDFIAVKGETDLKDASKKSAKESGTAWSWDDDSDRWNKDFRFDTFTRRALSIGVSYVYTF